MKKLNNTPSILSGATEAPSFLINPIFNSRKQSKQRNFNVLKQKSIYLELSQTIPYKIGRTAFV